jgi:hypothetical protein
MMTVVVDAGKKRSPRKSRTKLPSPNSDIQGDNLIPYSRHKSRGVPNKQVNRVCEQYLCAARSAASLFSLQRGGAWLFEQWTILILVLFVLRPSVYVQR